MSRSSFDPIKYQSVHDVVMELVQHDSDTDSYETLFHPKVGEVFTQIIIDASRKAGEAADSNMFIDQGLRINRNRVLVEYLDHGTRATITIRDIRDIRGTASALQDAAQTLTMLRNSTVFSIHAKSKSLGWRKGIECIVTIKKL